MIFGADIPDPTAEDILAIDDELANSGVPAFERPFEATKIWGDRHGGAILALPKEGLFREAFRALHPSVPFDSDSFLTLCVSARGISYIIRPPVILGRGHFNPIDHVSITKSELERLYHRTPSDFWELHWQAFDAIDLFAAQMNYHPKNQAARNMIGTAVNQMTASARQLVACEIDSSLPQGMALACELAGKSVFLHCGGDPERLKKIGHNLPTLVGEIKKAAKLPISPVQLDIDMIAAEMPRYVEMRYSSPPMTMLDAQDLFRRAMFFIADFLRRTNHDQAYWRKLRDGDMPSRSFRKAA